MITVLPARPPSLQKTCTQRNLACELSQGELIAHWDDDDWSAPHRLSLQVNKLRTAGADVCGARELLHYAPMSGEAWLYRHPPDERPWLAGGTLLYRRSLWAAHPFTDITVGEDSAFVWQLPADRIHALGDSSFYVALLHGGNTAPKNLRDPRWERRPLDEVSRLLAFDRDFYVALRNGRAALAFRGGPSPAMSVTVGAPFVIYDGYGSMYYSRGFAVSRCVVALSLSVMHGLRDVVTFRHLLPGWVGYPVPVAAVSRAL